MKRCAHEWEPLIQVPGEIPADKRLVIAFGVGLSHLDGYDRCRLCGRLSWITRSRRRRRKLMSVDPERILRRAAELQEWIAQQIIPAYLEEKNMRKHYVTFFSPGTFFAEMTCKLIPAWDVPTAVALSSSIVERYDAKPLGFQFVTTLSADPVPDGEGGMLPVQEKEVAKSGMYYLGGILRTVDQVRVKADPQEKILLANMEGNGWPLVCQNDNSWRSTMPFEEQDCIVDGDGNVVERGSDPKHVAYRQQAMAEIKKRRGY